MTNFKFTKTGRLYDRANNNGDQKLATAKQNTSKRPPLKLKPQWHGHPNTQPSKTRCLRSEATCDVANARAQQIQRFKIRVAFRRNPSGTSTRSTRTLADACEILSVLATHPRVLQTRPDLRTPSRTGSLRYAFEKQLIAFNMTSWLPVSGDRWLHRSMPRSRGAVGSWAASVWKLRCVLPFSYPLSGLFDMGSRRNQPIFWALCFE